MHENQIAVLHRFIPNQSETTPSPPPKKWKHSNRSFGLASNRMEETRGWKNGRRCNTSLESKLRANERWWNVATCGPQEGTRWRHHRPDGDGERNQGGRWQIIKEFHVNVFTIKLQYNVGIYIQMMVTEKLGWPGGAHTSTFSFTPIFFLSFFCCCCCCFFFVSFFFFNSLHPTQEEKWQPQSSW